MGTSCKSWQPFPARVVVYFELVFIVGVQRGSQCYGVPMRQERDMANGKPPPSSENPSAPQPASTQHLTQRSTFINGAPQSPGRPPLDDASQLEQLRTELRAWREAQRALPATQAWKPKQIPHARDFVLKAAEAHGYKLTPWRAMQEVVRKVW
jgi:hypothetical protein